MVRWVYLALLRLHPRAFRERFGDEMIAIFEAEERNGKNLALLFDAVASLFRQHFLRTPRRQPSLSMAGPVGPPDVPLFHTFDSSLPRRSALLNGALLSLMCLALLNFANSRGADKVIYAGYFPMGLSLARIFSELPDVGFKDEVWPKFLRENAIRVFGL